MVATPELIDRLLTALAPLEPTARAMFGGHCLYVDGRVVALVDDDALFVKRTEAGAALAPDLPLQPPYEGAKPAWRVEPGQWSDGWLPVLLSATAAALPKPRPRRPR